MVPRPDLRCFDIDALILERLSKSARLSRPHAGSRLERLARHRTFHLRCQKPRKIFTRPLPRDSRLRLRARFTRSQNRKILASVSARATSDLRALARLARPKGGAALLAYPLVGYGFGLWDLTIDVIGVREISLVLIAWFVASAGTMWLNASLDGEEGSALFAHDSPTPRPARLAAWGYAAIGTGVSISAFANTRIFVLCVACAALSIAYSHPRTRWKAHPVLGPAVNALGYGVLSPLAGLSAASVPVTPRAAVVLACISLWTLGATFAAQAFQQDDDARRGYRTFVVTHGPTACLEACRLTTIVPVVVLVAMSAVGVLPRALLVGAPFFVLVDRHVVKWLQEPGGGSPKWAAGYMVRMLAGGALFVGLATADFLYDFLADRPAGGAATVHWATPSS